MKRFCCKVIVLSGMNSIEQEAVERRHLPAAGPNQPSQIFPPLETWSKHAKKRLAEGNGFYCRQLSLASAIHGLLSFYISWMGWMPTQYSSSTLGPICHSVRGKFRRARGYPYCSSLIRPLQHNVWVSFGIAIEHPYCWNLVWSHLGRFQCVSRLCIYYLCLYVQCVIV
jgi:hypothetical protein